MTPPLPPLPENPLVSVIVRTCAGRRRLLAECLASIDAQTYRNVEIVVIEDGSEAAAEIVSAFAAQTDLRVVYRAIPKSGRCRAGNAGLEAASGLCLNFLDDDDRFFPSHVGALVEALLAHPEAAAARARSLEVPTVYRSLEPLDYREGTPRPFRDRPFSRAELWHRNFAPIQAILFRRELYERWGGLNPDLDQLEDWDLWMRFFSSADVVCVDETTSLFRVPGDAAGRRRRERGFAPHLPLIEARRKEIAVTLSVAEILEISREVWRRQYPGLSRIAGWIEWLKAGRARRRVAGAAWGGLVASIETVRAASRKFHPSRLPPLSDGDRVRRWIERSGRTVLHLLHNSPLMVDPRRPPGGVERHVADLCASVEDAAPFSLYAANGAYHLTAHLPGVPRRWSFSTRRLELARLLDRRLFDVVHVHQVDKFDRSSLVETLLRHGSYFVSLHDFALCCPNVNLLGPDGQPCDGHACSGICGRRPTEIESHRALARRLLAGARAVFHFSDSTRELVAGMLGGEYAWQRIEHGLPAWTAGGDSRRRTDDAKPQAASAPHARPLRVAFLGQIGPHKGADLIRRVVRHRRLPGGVPVEWRLIGTIRGGIDRSVAQTGRYEREELPAIFEQAAPDLVVLPSVCPETYGYTLDEAVRLGVPVVASPLGALGERVRRLGCGWVLDRLDEDCLLAALDRIAGDWEEYQRIRRNLSAIELPGLKAVAARYAEHYGDATGQGRTADGPSLPVALDRLAVECPAASSLGRRWLSAAFNGGISLLEVLRLRDAVERVALRLLPVPARARLNDLRTVHRAGSGE